MIEESEYFTREVPVQVLNLDNGMLDGKNFLLWDAVGSFSMETKRIDLALWSDPMHPEYSNFGLISKTREQILDWDAAVWKGCREWSLKGIHVLVVYPERWLHLSKYFSQTIRERNDFKLVHIKGIGTALWMEAAA